MNKPIDTKEQDELIGILETLIQEDTTITVRAVARLHSTMKHASSFTRNGARKDLISSYQTKQKELRQWGGRSRKVGNKDLAGEISKRDSRIKELESLVETLAASHVAMIRVVGELGGMSKWLALFRGYDRALDQLRQSGAMPKSNEKVLRSTRKT